jgi:carbamoyl-phosphate synthase large subunit
VKKHLPAGYRMVDNCAAEFEAQTPYFLRGLRLRKRSGAVSSVGGTPASGACIVFRFRAIRIGQGIEFDYASVQLRLVAQERAGFEVIIVNIKPR